MNQPGNDLATNWQRKSTTWQLATSPYKTPLPPDKPAITWQQTGNQSTGNQHGDDRTPTGVTVGVRRRLPSRPPTHFILRENPQGSVPACHHRAGCHVEVAP